MASIYELTSEFLTLYNLMEEGEIPADVLAGALETTREELDIKVEGYCKWLKNLEADAEGLKKEEERLAARRKTIENTIKNAKKAMTDALTVALKDEKEKKVKAGTFTVRLQKNPPSVVLDDPYVENFPEQFIKVKDPELDRKAILEALKAASAEDATAEAKALGKELEGLAHIEQSDGIRIR